MGHPSHPPLARRTGLSYLVLLRAGFCVPPVLPRARCALTAPFHHCHPRPEPRVRLCVFCATFLQVALTGRYPAHCPAEFGLSSPSSRLAALGRGGRLSRCEESIVYVSRRSPG